MPAPLEGAPVAQLDGERLRASPLTPLGCLAACHEALAPRELQPVDRVRIREAAEELVQAEELVEVDAVPRMLINFTGKLS